MRIIGFDICILASESDHVLLKYFNVRPPDCQKSRAATAQGFTKKYDKIRQDNNLAEDHALKSDVWLVI